MRLIAFAFKTKLNRCMCLDRFTDNSDIDLIVDIDSNDPFDYADSYFNLKFALQDLFNRPIDLLENKAIKNPYIRQNIDDSKSLIYAR
jgi:uncharacterized protein